MRRRTYLIELASVVIGVVDADLAAKDAGIAADREVVWHEGATVGLQHDLALEEGALRCTRVHLLGLGDHDRFILEVVEDGHLSDLGVLQAALNNVLFEETVESQDL